MSNTIPNLLTSEKAFNLFKQSRTPFMIRTILYQCKKLTFSTSSKYSRLSLSRSWRDPLKHFKISVLRHIRFSELRKIQIAQPKFTNEYVIRLLQLEIHVENIVEKEQFLLLITIFCYLMLGFYVKTRTRNFFQDKRLFVIIEVEITRVGCTCYLV